MQCFIKLGRIIVAGSRFMEPGWWQGCKPVTHQSVPVAHGLFVVQYGHDFHQEIICHPSLLFRIHAIPVTFSDTKVAWSGVKNAVQCPCIWTVLNCELVHVLNPNTAPDDRLWLWVHSDKFHEWTCLYGNHVLKQLQWHFQWQVRRWYCTGWERYLRICNIPGLTIWHPCSASLFYFFHFFHLNSKVQMCQKCESHFWYNTNIWALCIFIIWCWYPFK